MKVAHVGKHYFPVLGGIEKHMQMVAEGLVSRGFDVDVIVSNNRFEHVEEVLGGVNVEKLPRIFRFMNQPFSPHLLFKDFSDYDIVHLHLPNPWASFCLQRKDIEKLVITYHSDIIKYGWKKIPVKLYRGTYKEKIMEKADKIIATSPRYVVSSPMLKKYRKRVKVIPLGINLERFKKNGETEKKVEKLREELELENEKVMLFIGRLVPYKGLKYFIRALSKINTSVDYRVLIIGSGPLEGMLKKMVQGFGLGDRVSFLGRVDEVVPYYYLSDFFVLPSTYRAEAFGIVQMESMACGKPIVSTNLDSGVPFVNKDGESGLIAEPRDSEDLSKKVKRMVEDDELREKLGRGAKGRVEKMFSRERMMKSIVELYESL